MGSMQTQDLRSEPVSPAALRLPHLEAGWQRQGKLWSTLKELCALLRIPVTSTMTDDDLLFQHVQFKTGQRIHTIGQPFDTLYIVHSGFLKTVLIDEYGNEQVLSFPMKGDLFGVDGIHTRHYRVRSGGPVELRPGAAAVQEIHRARPRPPRTGTRDVRRDEPRAGARTGHGRACWAR